MFREPQKIILFGIVAGLAMAGFFSCLWLFFNAQPWGLQEAGLVGDASNLYNTVATVIATVLLFIGVLHQRIELKNQRKELENQRKELVANREEFINAAVENAFFKMLDAHNEHVAKLSFRDYDSVGTALKIGKARTQDLSEMPELKGRDAVADLAGLFKDLAEQWIRANKEGSKRTGVTVMNFSHKLRAFKSYCTGLNNLINYIDKHEEYDHKPRLIGVLTNQFTEDDLFLIFHWLGFCKSTGFYSQPNHIKQLYNHTCKYSMLRNISTFDYLPQKLSDEAAFNSAPYWDYHLKAFEPSTEFGDQ